MFTISVLLGICVLGVVFLYAQRPDVRNPERLQVAVTFFPLAEFARNIGGEDVEVLQVVPEGVEPHEYEPTSQDIQRILSSDIILVNGGGVDVWAEDLARRSGIPFLVMSDIIPFLEQDSVQDPHVWLDMVHAKTMVGTIALLFAQIDEVHQTTYATRASAFSERLSALDMQFSSMIDRCALRTIFVAHNAFSYWEVRYNVDVRAIAEGSSEGESSVQDIVQSIHEAQAAGVTTIFFESPEHAALVETIAQEIGVHTDVLSPLETRTSEQAATGATYETLMQENITALSRALACQY